MSSETATTTTTTATTTTAAATTAAAAAAAATTAAVTMECQQGPGLQDCLARTTVRPPERQRITDAHQIMRQYLTPA